MDTTKTHHTLSTKLVLLMAIAISATAANIYYNQPLLPSIAQSLGIDGKLLGLVPSSTQFGYAAAILFISPLGDKYNRKSIIGYLSLTLILGLLATYFSTSLIPLILASFVVGLSANITQQLLPLASSLTTQATRGKVIATLMTGLTLGILISRVLSGSISEYFGWRFVYLFAAFVALIVGLLLMRSLPNTKPTSDLTYLKLLASMLTLLKVHPSLRSAAITGALWFAGFNALWATLAIHLGESPFSYTAQQAGLFGFLGLAGIFSAKLSGRLVNRWGANKLIGVALFSIILGFITLAIWGNSLSGMIIGIILLDLGVFGAQIPNQVRIFSIDPKAQSRVNAIYMLCYYLGGALGSAVGVQIFSQSGWLGLSLFGLLSAILAFDNQDRIVKSLCLA